MASKRGPESFMKRQRERAKQQEQMAKDARRREKSALKKEAKLNAAGSPLAKLAGGPLGPVKSMGFPPGGRV
jgi:hypothetical protein